jgi:NAD(P)-dependent dehydrogenase (short-subunit alcohol dehydrogenase family)
MGLLDGKVAIVTGAGGGIGREHALALAKEGASVVVNDLGGSRDGTGGSHAMADQVVEEIKRRAARPSPNYDDVATVEGGEQHPEERARRLRQVDVLVNNAGILRDKSFAKITEDSGTRHAVHLKGTYCVTHAVWRNHMKEAGRAG